MDLSSTGLRVERRGRTAWCTVDNPLRPQTMSDAMYTDLGRLIDKVEADPDLDVLVVTGSGDVDRKSTRLNSSHIQKSRMPSSA